MSELKAHEAERWLANEKGRRPPVILIYGPDRGLVSERASRLAAQSGVQLNDAFSVTRLDATDIDRDPARLVDEASTVSMFADRRLIWIRGAGAQKAFAQAVKTLCAEPPASVLVLIEGGDLKKGSGVRAVIEASSNAIAIPCFEDDEQALKALIASELGRHGLNITEDAAELLRSGLGGDRLATRGELEKLALYASGAGTISVEDVRAATGDAAAMSSDDVIDSALSGRGAEFDAAFSRLIVSGTQAAQLLLAALRLQQQLLSLKAIMDTQGASAGTAVAGARPAIHFSRRKLVEGALARASTQTVLELGARLSAAILSTRTQPSLATEATYRALFAMCRLFAAR